jgi:hypothetical protein
MAIASLIPINGIKQIRIIRAIRFTAHHDAMFHALARRIDDRRPVNDRNVH